LYAIVVGLSGVGESLAKALISKGHTVAIIDLNKERCSKFSEEYDALVICGDALEKDNLRDAGVEKAEALVAATGDDSVNLMVASMAKDFGVKTLIAVVRNPEHKELFERIGVKIIIPDDVVAEHLYQKLYMVEDFLYLGGKKAEIFLVKVENGGGKALDKLNLPNGCSIIGIYRNGSLQCPPSKNTTLQPGDELLVYTNKPENIKKAVEVFRKINGA